MYIVIVMYCHFTIFVRNIEENVSLHLYDLKEWPDIETFVL